MSSALRAPLLLALSSAAVLSADTAFAEVALSGYLIATDACPAPRTIRNPVNPGDVTTETDRAYRLVGKNKEAATHYLVIVPGADPERRWVELRFGIHVVPFAGGQAPEPADGNRPEPSPVPGGRADFVLAASWQPGFCETKPGKTECGNQTESRFDASNFALHGLWPQPRGNEYCQVTPGEAAAAKDRRWSELPELMLDADTRTELDKVMPGSQSHLDRYEWIKHGTCYGDTVEEYYSDSLAVMAALNGSAVRELFASRIGQQVTVEEIRNAFDNSFGAGAGDRVTVSCTRDGGRRIITELQINLTGEIVDADSFVQNLVAAPSRDPGCPSGIVDAVGLQ